ncbi:dTDP-4-dehydrorhamnose reductase [Desulfuromonas soudanensis]|uniref:dTDP-4-dehydrorhamnose reductase n=1 Tax=Desulfuromonas soudanensis TaxID=1603606 RepID=A0A0M4D0J2_9BACT|nr:dTDP-4-dehydrorhamnose reductase [Desulfuromonas soudanensis]ALC16465.1 dTDP-4-dehydrorhamnose reductase [Desulfuromonas soudanensis]
MTGPAKCLALIGAKGMLASMVLDTASADFEITPFDLPEFDLTDASLVQKVIGELKPDVIINCAAFTAVDACETNEDLANKVNGEGPGILAAAALKVGATLVHISTDYVFDGKQTRPYAEEDRPNPSSAYGRSKLLGEEAIRSSGLKEYFIIRTSWLYGPGGKNFVETVARLAAERQELRIVADQFGTPTYTGDLAGAIFNLLDAATVDPPPANSPYGLYHFSNEGECSWHDFALAIVEELKGRGATVVAEAVLPIRTEEYPLPAPRPAYSVFSKEKYRRVTGATVPHWKESLIRYFDRRSSEV